MPADHRELLEFFDAQRRAQASRFASVPADKLLTFMATTRRRGAAASVGVASVAGFEAAPEASGLVVRLRGALPREPGPGECVTVHVTRLELYQGYQLKTVPAGPGVTAQTVRQGDELRVRAARVFTVHHSPYTMRFFEEVPLEEVRETVGGVANALVAVGEEANLSPRFVWHVDEVDGRLALYHGDGLALKTYTNLRSNPLERRLVLDLDTYSGYVLEGEVAELPPSAHPAAYARVCAGFAAGDWGKPARFYRLLVDRWSRIDPRMPLR